MISLQPSNPSQEIFPVEEIVSGQLHRGQGSGTLFFAKTACVDCSDKP